MDWFLYDNGLRHEKVKKDAKCLDNLQKVFADDETNLKFKHHLNMMKSAFYEARCNAKTRITETIVNKQRNHEGGG